MLSSSTCKKELYWNEASMQLILYSIYHFHQHFSMIERIALPGIENPLKQRNKEQKETMIPSTLARPIFRDCF